ncbi:hypothetical protein BDP27DRAFT_1385203 [Rhodocollybia butyracea]|uniref:Uncharacterized protein n=1 Tax=Rhodocollybia butyracea TaxID=206335 RepID=A0A9P5PFA9_9AGAR|nr:hypothetical protein BDP27DRAFT_1385203 [Rhodocollybia butyracea]
MSSLKESWSTSQTIVRVEHPQRYTGLERIILAAQGDLQRLLSAYFANTITVQVVSLTNSPRLSPASPSNPITQQRQVLLKCRNVVVCTATSTVTLTSPECERIILDEGYAIGQAFRSMGRVPEFRLVKVMSGLEDEEGEGEGEQGEGMQGERDKGEGEQMLKRVYTLGSPGIDCLILEEFPSRDMFVDGDKWISREIARCARNAASDTDGSGSE